MASAKKITALSAAEIKSRWSGHSGASLQLVWFLLAYLIFGVVGGISSILCLALSFLLPSRLRPSLGQAVIQRLFAFFVWYLQRTGLATIDFHDLGTLPDGRGIIIAANHPTLLDAVFVVSRLPRAICLMKAGIVSNLVLCGTARLAGYVDNRSPRRMVETCAARLQQGNTLVIFPEGTRTVEDGVNSFKMGFALIAKLADAPVQTVFIKANSSFLSKDWPFFKAPSAFPLRYSIRLGKLFVCDQGQDPKAFGKEVEDYFRSSLGTVVGSALEDRKP